MSNNLKYHFKISGRCLNCQDELRIEDYSKEGETKEQLELRLLGKFKNPTKDWHICTPKVIVSIPHLPTECLRCGYEFKNSKTIIKAYYTEKEIKELEMDFVGKAMHAQKEHRKSCILAHTQTRLVIFEKCPKKIR